MIEPNEVCYSSSMDLNDYQQQALTTAIYPGRNDGYHETEAIAVQVGEGLKYCALKLCGEAGEFAEKVGKLMRDKRGAIQPQDWELMVKELGDVLWYVSAAADELGAGLGHVAIENLRKLKDRAERNKLGGSGDTR